MFTTIEQVKELTNVDVTQQTITMAQGIMEAYVGKDEAEISNGYDLALLAKATAYQSAYMQDDEEKVFNQMAIVQTSQYGASVTFMQDGVSPWISPLARNACNKLSWKRIRSVKTGSIYYTPPVDGSWETA